MKIKCECSREVMAQRDVYMPNYEAITWYCPYCSRSGTKLIKYCRHGPMVIYDQRERVSALKLKLQKLDSQEAKLLTGLADNLYRLSVPARSSATFNARLVFVER